MKSTRCKVAVLAGYQKSLILFRKALLGAMVREGHEVVACAPESEMSVTAQLKAIGVDYHVLPFHRTGTNLLRDLRAVLSLRHFYARTRPDLVFAYTIKPVIYGSLAARWVGVSPVFSMITGLGHTFAAGGCRRQLLKASVSRLYRLALRHNRAVFFQNADDRAYFKAHQLIPPECPAILVNGSGVDLEEFRPAPWPEAPCSFLLLARLIAEKGIRDYVAAARWLKQRHPRLIFRLGGFIDARAGSITAVELEAWKRERLIEFLGWLDDVRPAIGACSVYVLPSYYPEGAPHSILEAMAMGRPIVTTDEPGCRQTVQNGVNGWLVPARSPERLAKTMEQFVLHPALIPAMGRQSRLLAEARYDLRQVNQILMKSMGLTVPGHSQIVPSEDGIELKEPVGHREAPRNR